MVFCYGILCRLRQHLVLRSGGCYNKYLRLWTKLRNWAIGKGWKCFDVHTRNLEANNDSSEISGRNREHVIGNWKKGDPCYEVAKSLAEMCSNVLWKIKFVRNDIYQRRILRKVLKSVAWVLLIAYSKMQKEIN